MGITVIIQPGCQFMGNVFHRRIKVLSLGGKIFVDFSEGGVGTVKYKIFIVSMALCAEAQNWN